MEKWELKANSRIFSWEGRSVNKTQKQSVDVIQSFSRKPFDTYIPNQALGALFWEKSVLVLGKKNPDCVHLYVECLTWNADLKASRRKNFNTFPFGAFLWCVADTSSLPFKKKIA